ncbi:GntR family transcriptional regulator [Devosia sp. A449]
MSTLPITPIAHSTMHEHVYKRLCELILDGSIAPGQLVTINGLADAFGVSAMPVREALKRLTAANALTVVSGRTIGVPNLDAARLRDLRRVRLLLEPAAARWAAERVDAPFLAVLTEILAELEAAAKSMDRAVYVRANYKFHFTIYKQAASETALSAIETLWLRVGPSFHLLQKEGQYSYSNMMHEAALDALRNEDADAAEKAITSDIKDGMDSLLALV